MPKSVKKKAIKTEKTEIYFVEKIVNKRYVGKKMLAQYLVKWQHYSDAHNTWEPLDSLVKYECQELIDDFELNAIRERVQRRKRATNNDNKNNAVSVVKSEDNKALVKLELKSQSNAILKTEVKREEIKREKEVKPIDHIVVKRESSSRRCKQQYLKEEIVSSIDDSEAVNNSEIMETSVVSSSSITEHETVIIPNEIDSEIIEELTSNNININAELIAATNDDSVVESEMRTAISGLRSGVKPLQILGVCDTQPKLSFAMAYVDSDKTDVVSAEEANELCPQIVIQYYESLIKWNRIERDCEKRNLINA